MLLQLLTPDNEHILVNAIGVLYHEISASNLVKIPITEGVVSENAISEFFTRLNKNVNVSTTGVDQDSLQLHIELHRRRPDMRCIVHVQSPVIGAVSHLENVKSFHLHFACRSAR